MEVKEEVVDSETEADRDWKTVNQTASNQIVTEEKGRGEIELLAFEEKLLVDTMDDDVLFICARGLSLERLFLNHLVMYSSQKLFFLVLNTTNQDEAFFLEQLKIAKVPCLPKLINSDVNIKDREAVYLEGGVQFITSRILLVDLLTERIPVKNLAGILVYRAHEVLNSFQESFILRLYREKKRGGIVKAFTDFPTALSSLGNLQRAVSRLYVKRARLLPRFDVDVRNSFEVNPAHITELDVFLPAQMRRVHTTIYDLIKVCHRELKQCSTAEKVEEEENSIGFQAYAQTKLEKQLNQRKSYLSDKQRRVMSDLILLRELLRIAEDQDAATLLSHINKFRNDKEMLEQSCGWLLSATGMRLVSDVEELSGMKAAKFTPPPKWEILESVLKEIKAIPLTAEECPEPGPCIFIFVSTDSTLRQVEGLLKNGPERLAWLVQMEHRRGMREPARRPLWPEEMIEAFGFNPSEAAENRAEVVSGVKKQQKETARASRKRRKAAQDLVGCSDSKRQTNIVQFGILQFKKRTSDTKEVEVKIEEPVEEEENTEQQQTTSPKTVQDYNNASIVVLTGHNRYKILEELESRRPTFVIFYNARLDIMRTIEMYRALHSEQYFQAFHVQYRESTEEQRHLAQINSETKAFENLVREQGTLMVHREYDTIREEAPRLRLSTRDGGAADQLSDERPKIVVDMREFNSELPTILYMKGYDTIAATIEVGDYVLSNEISIERKALDDLTQSLQSGRVFKQAEQMLAHYSNSVLLIESNRKFETKIVNGGPFQGELSRHCREVRQLFCALIRGAPKLKTIWSLSPQNSAEYFTELKLNQAEPDVERAIALKSDQQGENVIRDGKKANERLLRQLSDCLPGMARGDVHVMMASAHISNVSEMLSSSVSVLHAAAGVHADRLFLFATFDFSQGSGS